MWFELSFIGSQSMENKGLLDRTYLSVYYSYLYVQDIGYQTMTLWIYHIHPTRIKRAGYLFEFHLSITLAVI